MMQGFTFNSSQCIGCKACQSACKEKNHLPIGSFFRRVDTIADTRQHWVHLSASCSHCTEPVCMSVCPVSAISKGDDGIVVIHENRCIGCGQCAHSCPGKAIVMDGMAKKCDGCADLRSMGRNPACVDACPTKALQFGQTDHRLQPSIMVNPDPAPSAQKAAQESIPAAWSRASDLVHFFTDFPRWYSEHYKAAPAPALIQEYSDLFWGTNAAVSIPLWASVCEGGALLDSTTLEILQEYHSHGYHCTEMDGNPPDYVGQMLRYMCYLSACSLAPGDAFLRHLSTTLRTVANGIRKYTSHEPFLSVAALLEQSGSEPAGHSEDLECAQFALTGPTPIIPNGEIHTIHTAGRNNCGGKCSIVATEQDGCVLRVETGCHIGDPTIKACVRGSGYRTTYLTGQRLRYPMKRIGKRGEGHFCRISWEEAADLIASEWKRIRDTYGPGSRYINYGDGVAAVIRPDELAKRLLNLDGGYLSRFGSYSSACARYATPYVYGDTHSGNSNEDLLNSKLILLWGHNPTETIYAPQLSYYIVQARKNGAKVIVIDPRNSDTAIGLADEWIPIRPSTDGALADAMAYVIWSEGLQDQDFMDRCCIGFDEAHMPEGVPAQLNYRNYLSGGLDGIVKTPEWAQAITGVPAEKISALARAYATVKPACLLPGLGNQRTGNGEQTVRAMATLACLTGNVGIPGGGAAGAGGGREEPSISFPVGTSAYPGAISCFLWLQAVENGSEMTAKEDRIEGMEKLDSDIKMILNLASNTLINQHSDINHSIEVLQDESKCEFIVCSDVFMTPSAKFADILLPAPSFLEEDNIAEPWRMGHYLLCNNKVVDPLFGCRNEYYWLGEVAKRLGLWDQWSEGRTEPEQWLEHLYHDLKRRSPELPDYAQFKAAGGYAYCDPKPYIAFEAQVRDPQAHPFPTPSGKIEIVSKRLYDMGKPQKIPALPIYVPCAEGPEDPLRKKYPLQLIGWHTKRRCHTIHDNNPAMEELDPQRMWMHPEDAAARDISDGDTVEVFNDRGRLRIPVLITPRIVMGTVAIAQGAWYTPDQDGVDLRGSINVLTSSRPTPLAKGNPQHTNLVEVKSLP